MNFAQLLLRHRMTVLVALIVATLGAAWAARSVRLDNSIEIWFLDDDADLVAYRSFLERFEADEIVVIGVFSDDIFTPEHLRAIRAITDRAAEAPWVHQVRSITAVNVPTATDDGVDIAPLIGAIPSEASALSAIRERALADPTVVGNLIAPDGRAAAVVVEMSPKAQDFERKIEMVQALVAIAAEETQGVEGLSSQIAGSPALDEAFLRHMRSDFFLLGPGTTLLMIVVLSVIFRRASAVVIPLVVVLVSILWLFGVMGLIGLDLNIISNGLPAVILAVGMADSVHVLSDYYQELAKGRSQSDAICRSFSALLVPCTFTSATTAAGMLSLVVSDLVPVAQFGWQAAIGVVFAFISSMIAVPVLLSFTKLPDEAFLRRHTQGSVGRTLNWLATPSLRRATIIAVASTIVVVASAYGAAGLRVSNNPMNYFHEGDPIRDATQAIDVALGGTASVELLLEGQDDQLKSPETLARVEALQNYMASQPGVSKVLSVVDSLKQMNRVLSGPSANVLPSSQEMNAQFYLLLEGNDDLSRLVQDNYSVGRVTARVQMSNAEALAANIPAIEKTLAQKFSDDTLRVSATGFIKLMSEMEHYLIQSQIESFSLALVVIVVMMGILLRSLRLALFSMIPNFLPILAGLGFMGALSIPLDPGTVMIGSIALGMVVDDTVHFMVRLRRQAETSAPLNEAVANTVVTAGRPIVITSIILMAGFSVLMFASFSPNLNFGLVTALVVGLALIGDLVVLPAALLLIRPRL